MARTPDLDDEVLHEQVTSEQREAAREKKDSHPTRGTVKSSQPNRPWPVLVLALLTMWFAYDGWFNPEMEWTTLNRVGAVVLGCFTAFAAIRHRRRT